MDELETVAIKNNKTNGISKPIFEILVYHMDFKTFFIFGSRVCKTFRRFFFNSNRWRIIDLSFLSSSNANFNIYKLCGVLRAYHQESSFVFEDEDKNTSIEFQNSSTIDNSNNNNNNANINNSNNNNNNNDNDISNSSNHFENNNNDYSSNNNSHIQNNSNNHIVDNSENKNKNKKLFFTPYVETLILDSLYKANEECFKYINNCRIMDKIEHLSLMKTGIRSLNIFFDQPRNILSLALPTLSENQTDFYKSIPNLKSLAINGLFQPVQVYRFLDSCKKLQKLDIFHSLKTLNENLSSKLITCTQITHLRLSNIDITTDILLSLFMSLINLENLVVHNIPQLTSPCVDTALESLKNLKEFNIKFCRNANTVTESSRSLQIFDCSYCGIKNFDFPNLESLSMGGYSLTNDEISSIYSQFISLKYLDLSKADITNEKLQLIFKYVGKDLQVLNLFDNRTVNSETIDLILSNCPKLYKLYIDNQNLSKETSSKLNSLNILLKLN